MSEQGLNVRDWLERFLSPSNHDLAVARAQYGAASNLDVLREQARGQIASDLELAVAQHVESVRARHVREAVEGLPLAHIIATEGGDGIEYVAVRYRSMGCEHLAVVHRAALLDALGGQTLDESPGKV